MTPEQSFYTRITALAGMVPHFVLSKELLAIYDAQLSPLGYEEVCWALDQIIGNRSSRDPFPSIREIKEVLTPSINPEHEAIEAVSRIIAAIASIGPYQTERAKSFVGELGWVVVQSEGGWENICKVLTDENIGTLRAQWRNLAIAKWSRASHGVIDAPRLPVPSEIPGPKSIGLTQLLKQIPKN